MTTSRPDPLEADVLVSAEVPPERERALVEAFGALDVAARARVLPTRRGPETWMVLATLPLQAFMSAVVAKLAEDAHKGIKRLVGQVFADRRAPARPDQVLVLQDQATRLQVVLEADLPAEAYRQLVSLDLSAIGPGPVHYDRHRREWRSELAEWERRQPPPG
jgi:hypothetical protein